MSADGIEVEPRTSGGNDRVRVDVDAAEVDVSLGATTTVRVEVTNIDQIIRSFRVDVLGLDPDWIEVDDTVLDLFPDERRDVLVAFTLPEAFPSGRRSIAIEVSEPDAVDDTAVMIAFDLVMEAVDELGLWVEPESLTAGGEGSFLLHPVNSGNTTLEVTLTASDPERLTTVVFEPAISRLVPGEQGVVRATVTGKRPWFGMPAVRLLTFTAEAGVAEIATIAVFMQRPRFSRRMLAFLGLLAAVTLFAFVIFEAFGSVAERAADNEKLLRQGLGEDQVVGVRTDAALISGTVTSTTTGGVDGAAVALFDAASPALPVHSTVTDATGRYGFSSLSDGAYLVRVEVAGYGERWYPAGETLADAEPIEISAGSEFNDIDIELVGRPGSVAGVVLGEDVVGATVSVAIPGELIEGSDVEPVAAIVASVELDATGQFLLEDLATPATYELVVAKPGYATDASALSLRAGEQRDGLEVLLRRGDGRIAGTVVDTAGDPLPNVSISATDGVTTTATRSLGGDAGRRGTFELRDLPTPGTYTLTITADGYFDESTTVPLDAEQRVLDLQLVLTSDRGSISGLVTRSDGDPLGGVDITIAGADIERRTSSLSTGAVGSWLADDLPVPGTYTITFTSPTFTTQAVSIELVPGPGADVTDVNAVLATATASVCGRVRDVRGNPIGGVRIELDGGDVQRRTVSANKPAGEYRFDDLPGGAYTITFSRLGSRAQTLLVDLRPGQPCRQPTITLEDQATLKGVVTRNGRGEAGVGVVVYVLADYPGQVTAETVTTTGGAYEIVGLEAPETYIIEFRIPAGGAVVGSRTQFVQSGATVVVNADL